MYIQGFVPSQVALTSMKRARNHYAAISVYRPT